MSVVRLELAQFRCWETLRLDCSPTLNLLLGDNASGKTSILEALYLLGRGRSFRTAQVRELIRHQQTQLQLGVQLQAADSARRYWLGMQRSVREQQIRLDSQPVRSLAELATALPLLLLNPDSHRLLEDGPKPRRRFLDWGLFHHCAEFLPVWRRYSLALRQRNALLRSGALGRVLEPWEAELAHSATVLDAQRRQFCSELNLQLHSLVAELLPFSVQLDYRSGWNREQDLQALLRANREGDVRQGHTRSGPHRADFVLRSEQQPLQLSRGQQKLVVSALVLAQAQLYRQRQQQSCILLIDDLPAELDRQHCRRIVQLLAQLDCQVFITAIEPELIESGAWSNAKSWRLHAGQALAVV